MPGATYMLHFDRLCASTPLGMPRNIWRGGHIQKVFAKPWLARRGPKQPGLELDNIVTSSNGTPWILLLCKPRLSLARTVNFKVLEHLWTRGSSLKKVFAATADWKAVGWLVWSRLGTKYAAPNLAPTATSSLPPRQQQTNIRWKSDWDTAQQQASGSQLHHTTVVALWVIWYYKSQV